jgi:hypothetical protein
MSPAEIRAAALARSAPASTEVDRLRAAEVEAVAEDRAATQDRIRAEKRQTSAHHNLIATCGRLEAARDRLATHGALIEILNTDPTLIDDLHHLSYPPGAATHHVPPERMSALGCRGLIDRRHKRSRSVFSPSTPLTAAGWATLRLYREIVGAPLDSPAFATPTTPTTPTTTEDR